jgi:hypothetical protein
MEEQQDKDCYHYTSQDEIHKANHVEAITRDLEEARQKEVSNQEEIGERLITLCRREQGCRRSVDSPRWREPIIHYQEHA